MTSAQLLVPLVGIVLLAACDGAEFGVRGFVAAYDVDSGEREWVWYTVPGNPADGFENEQMQMAAQTISESGTWTQINSTLRALYTRDRDGFFLEVIERQ